MAQAARKHASQPDLCLLLQALTVSCCADRTSARQPVKAEPGEFASPPPAAACLTSPPLERPTFNALHSALAQASQKQECTFTFLAGSEVTVRAADHQELFTAPFCSLLSGSFTTFQPPWYTARPGLHLEGCQLPLQQPAALLQPSSSS